MICIKNFLAVIFALCATNVLAVVNETVCDGKTYVYEELAGFGLISGNAKDEFGDTIGGIGSGIALDTTKWTKLRNGSYSGVLWALPDRGWCVILFRYWSERAAADIQQEHRRHSKLPAPDPQI